MNELNCEYVRDVYPDVLSGKLDVIHAQQVRAHVFSCDDCRAEAAVLDLLMMQQVAAPSGLEARVGSALAQQQPRARALRHVWAAAASIAIALMGGSVLFQAPWSAADSVANARAYGFVGVEDAMLYGKASLSDLSEEELEMLLVEMES